MFTSVIPPFLPTGAGVRALAVFGVVFAVVGLLSCLAYAVALGTSRRVLRRPRLAAAFLHGSGGLLSVPGVVIGKVSDRTFLMHLGGKIEMASKHPIRNRDDLSMIYTPGVARVCLAIAKNPEDARRLTVKRSPDIAALTSYMVDPRRLDPTDQPKDCGGLGCAATSRPRPVNDPHAQPERQGRYAVGYRRSFTPRPATKKRVTYRGAGQGQANYQCDWHCPTASV